MFFPPSSFPSSPHHPSPFLDVRNLLVVIERVRAPGLCARAAAVRFRHELALRAPAPLAELDHVLLVARRAARAAGPQIGADQQEDDGHVEDHHDLEEIESRWEVSTKS